MACYQPYRLLRLHSNPAPALLLLVLSCFLVLPTHSLSNFSVARELEEHPLITFSSFISSRVTLGVPRTTPFLFDVFFRGPCNYLGSGVTNCAEVVVPFCDFGRQASGQVDVAITLKNSLDVYHPPMLGRVSLEDGESNMLLHHRDLGDLILMNFSVRTGLLDVFDPHEECESFVGAQPRFFSFNWYFCENILTSDRQNMDCDIEFLGVWDLLSVRFIYDTVLALSFDAYVDFFPKKTT
jgi:hypothetical protein